MRERRKIKSINKLHFIYSVSILAGIIIVLFATILLNYQNTVATLSNSGILLSIVLAIIAILITLWDVAGQKNALFDIKDQINIKEITDEIKESAESSRDLVLSLEDFDSRFGVNFEPIKEMLDSISNKIESSSLAPEIDGVRNAVVELRKMVTEKENNLNQIRNSIDTEKKLNNTQKYDKFLDLSIKFLSGLEKDEVFYKGDLVVFIFKELNINGMSTQYAIKVLKDLMKFNLVDQIDDEKYVKK